MGKPAAVHAGGEDAAERHLREEEHQSSRQSFGTSTYSIYMSRHFTFRNANALHAIYGKTCMKNALEVQAFRG